MSELDQLISVLDCLRDLEALPGMRILELRSINGCPQCTQVYPNGAKVLLVSIESMLDAVMFDHDRQPNYNAYRVLETAGYRVRAAPGSVLNEPLGMIQTRVGNIMFG